MAEPQGFLLYFTYRRSFERLSDEKAGQLVKALFAYAKNKEQPNFNDETLDVTFDIIREYIDLDFKKYAERCAKNAANGRKGGDKVKTALNSEANGSERGQSLANGGERPQSGANGDNININEDKLKNKNNCNESKGELKESKEPLSYAEQYESACKKYGKAVLEDYLQRVETYQQSSGKVYADKLATACLWIERDIADNKLVIKNTTYDLDEYEEWAKTYTPKLSTQESKKGG